MEMTLRLTPSSFDPHDPKLRGLRRASRWKTAAEALTALSARGVALTLPLFWQLEAPCFEICREIGLSLFVTQADNIPLLAASLRGANIDTVISEPTDAATLATYLAEKDMPLPQFLLVHRADSSWTLPHELEGAPRIAQEVHLTPGLPVFSQCATLIQARSSFFHTTNEALPAGFVLPPAQRGPECVCGQKTYAHL